MKISDTSTPFFKTTPLFYQPLPFWWEIWTPFYKDFENSNPPFVNQGGGGGECCNYEDTKYDANLREFMSNLVWRFTYKVNLKY